MVAVPASTPLTIPESDSTVATDVLPLLHVPPPPKGSLNDVAAPAHIAWLPDTDDGSRFTVTTIVEIHPAPRE